MITTSSRKKKYEGLNVADHRHCIICGGVVPPERDPPLCEGYCEEEFNRRQKRSKIFNAIWLIIILGLIVLLMLRFWFPAF